MAAFPTTPGAEAVRAKGWFGAHKWLVLRRLSQFGILALFLTGPLFGLWIVKGNLASSLTLDVLPLTDPFVLLQQLAARHWPETVALTGAVIVLVFYLVVGGRAYCSWVCPVNIVTDAAEWLRHRLRIKGGVHVARNARYWLLASILVVSLVSGTIAWELVNPVSVIFRGVVFGMGLGWAMVTAIFLLDFLVGRRLWCGHLCPVGAFYGLIGRGSVVRVSASGRENCDDCMDCFAVCPEQQVIRPALKGADKGLGPVIISGQCTNCGRCIDVCARDVFHLTTRFNNQSTFTQNVSHKSEVLT